MLINKNINAISLFSSAGIGELRLPKNINVLLANELIQKRADCYKFFNKNTDVLCGDITSKDIKHEIINKAKSENVKLLIATPPCQGLSTLGKNKTQEHYIKDHRNFLILEVLDIIDNCDFDYILIENVPKFIDMYFPFNNRYSKLEEILLYKYSNKYIIDIKILNAKDYGICQSRPRAIIKLWKRNLKWSWPSPQDEIPLKDVIGHLPSLEPGEKSGILWHDAKDHPERITTAVRHTKPGKSAIVNPIYYPKKENGEKIKGFHNTFKRMVWEKPCPARTTYCGSISSHNNIHPGYLQEDGTYSDPRVLTLLETFLVSSIPEDIKFPDKSSDTFIRTIIGESIPPKLMEKILSNIGE